jgi:tripartite ATP-independent transporter DctM subunit
VVTSARRKVPRQRFSWSVLRDAMRESMWEIPLPFVVLGGIYGGFFTITEAASVTAVYALLLEVVIYRDVNFGDLMRIFRESMELVGGILVILAAAMGLTNYFIDAEIPTVIFEWVQSGVQSRIVFLVILNVFLLLVGSIMDIFSAILVVVPLILPVAQAYGIDPVHLGIIFLTNLEIGYSTPPVGLNLFIASFRFREPVVGLYRASLPWLGLYLIALILVTYLPELSLWLVQALGVQ